MVTACPSSRRIAMSREFERFAMVLQPPSHVGKPLTRRAVLRGLGLGLGVAGGALIAGPTEAARLVGSRGLGGAVAAQPPWRKLRSSMTGPLYVKGQSGYSAVALGFNPRFDSILPAAVARCASAADVAAALGFARTYAVPFTVRSGGHSLAGWSTGTGLVIDITTQNQVSVDTGSGIATVGAGCRLIDVYQQVSAVGFALPAGTCPSVGMAGLTMGGGIGALTRSWGLTCDQLQSATVVFAGGSVKHVASDSWPNLLWALKGGGGGSFGVATSFDLKIRPAPTMQRFSLVYDWAAAANVLAGWQSWAPYADRRLSSNLAYRATRSSGSLTVGISGTWIGPASELDAQVDALVAKIGVTPRSRSKSTRTFSQAMLDDADCTSYDVCHLPPDGTVVRQPSAAASTMAYSELSQQGIQTVVDQMRTGLNVVGSTWTGVTLVALGGAVNDVDATTSAYGHRDALFMLHYLARWSAAEPGRDPAPFDGYVRGFRAAMRPYAGDGAYVNYQDSSIVDYGTAYWPGTYAKLRTVKTKVDPGNVFNFPQSVPPG